MNKYHSGPWLVALAALLWAIDAPFRKYLTADLSSTTIVFMEHILIAFVVVVWLRPYFKELKQLDWRGWLAVVFVGFGGSALATVLFTQSFHYLNPSVAILLQKVQPIVAILMAVVILKEKLNKQFWFWAVVAIAGAYIVTFPNLAVSGFSFTGGSLGALLALAAAFLWGGSTVFGRYLLKDLSFRAITAIRFLSALLFLFIIQLYYGRLEEIFMASSVDWLFIFLVAIVAGFISLFIYYRGLKYTSASIATLAELAFPVAAVIINWIFLGEILSWVQLIGGTVLIFAITQLSLINNSLTPA